jgi:hypothetical protein
MQNLDNQQSQQIASDANKFFNETNNMGPEYTNPGHSSPSPQIPDYPTEKTFKYANDCSISVGCTPSGFSTIIVYIKDSPFFGMGTLFSLSALEIKNAEIYYNSKKDFLFDEDINPNSNSPLDLDKDRRMHKVSIYKVPQTNEYRMDLVKLAKTGIPEIDAQDPWKDFSDIGDHGPGNKQIELVKKFVDVLRVSRNEPDMIITGKITEEYPELQPCVGIIVFKKIQ